MHRHQDDRQRRFRRKTQSRSCSLPGGRHSRERGSRPPFWHRSPHFSFSLGLPWASVKESPPSRPSSSAELASRLPLGSATEWPLPSDLASQLAPQKG